MTKLLEAAIEQVKSLPDADQDLIANWLFEELQSDRRWNDLFSRSPSLLEKLAGEAELEYRAGLTEVLDAEEL